MIATRSRLDWMQSAYDAPDAQDLKMLVEWLFREDQFSQLSNGEDLLKWALEKSDSAKPEISRLMRLVWNRREDLRRAFDLSTADGRKSLRDWFFETGVREHQFTPSLSSANPLSSLIKSVQNRLGGKRTKFATDGIAVLGSFPGQFGIGQHARNVVESMEAAQIKSDLINVTLGPHQTAATPYDARYLEASDFAINLFCLNVISGPSVIREIGANSFVPRHNISYGYWELERCPKQWEPYLALYDEFWAPTKFIADALRASTNKTVVHMPISITVPETPMQSREELGLPKEKFLFLFHFDGFSFARRKNPEAVVTAFKKAFPATNDNVALVIKTKNAPETAAKLQELIDGDARCIVIDADYSREQIVSLEYCCDAYVSLHRSEGFGMGPAEMMYLGKPVIVTNYSGNMDFTHPDNACLVDHELIDVAPGEYAFSEPGQRWAEPDVEHAAALMKKLYENTEFAKGVGNRAREYMREQHSPAVVGARYRERIRQIAALL
jgi:glycosyltransferase involved in cell wall biosynthesis